jgi:outer membrane lipoprotein-sorting protein
MKEKIDYIFDGQYLTEDNYKLKTRTRYQLAAKGETIEPLRIGQGPFPMPFGQKTADILEYLTPFTRKPTEKDPKNTDYIKLLPNKQNKDSVNFIRLEMWVDKTTNLPVKIVSKNKNKDVRTITFTNTKTSAKIDPKLFDVKKPFGFKLHIERMK